MIRDPPADQLRRSPESSDDDDGATGSGEPAGPLMPGPAFANWPFGDLEVDLSSKKKPGVWANGPGNGRSNCRWSAAGGHDLRRLCRGYEQPMGLQDQLREVDAGERGLEDCTENALSDAMRRIHRYNFRRPTAKTKNKRRQPDTSQPDASTVLYAGCRGRDVLFSWGEECGSTVNTKNNKNNNKMRSLVVTAHSRAILAKLVYLPGVAEDGPSYPAPFGLLLG